MAHLQQRVFCESVRDRFPSYFQSVFALDIGSFDINGNNHYLFDVTSLYLGIDVAPGRNVDIVCPAHQLLLPDATFDVIVSTECLEHDQYWEKTLRNAVRMLRPGGLLLISCATTGRPEHGTRRTTPEDAPLLAENDEAWADYYRNLTEDDFRQALDIEADFSDAEFSVGEQTHDLYFWGIKRGTFEKRTDRSASLDSHPSVMLKEQLIKLTSSFGNLREELERIQNSRSWRITQPLRVGMHYLRGAMLRRIVRQARNAMGYVIRGDFAGLLQRIKAIAAESDFDVRWPLKTWAILCTPHTLFVAHLLASRLKYHGWTVEILTKAPKNFTHDMYIVMAAQMFKKLPPGNKRIIYQLEQSISSRWFSNAYIHAMQRSRAVLDYALNNLEFLATKGIAYPHVFYLPIGSDPQYMYDVAPVEKTTDVLFYGDANSSLRRRELLEILKKHFDVRECSEIYGLDMVNAIRAARLVINLHYYENALLEMPRIQECLSIGTPVVSEAAQDQSNYPELGNAVTFFEEGNPDAMIAAVKAKLNQIKSRDKENIEAIKHTAMLGQAYFSFMLDRFLIAQGFIDTSHALNVHQPIDLSGGRVVLSMPETITRRRLFEAEKPKDFVVFNGLRKRPSWVGAGLSYQSLAKMMLDYSASHNGSVSKLMVIEDDVLLPSDFEEKIAIVQEYLDSLNDQWDIFAGLIADVHPKTKILAVDTFKGMRFVTIDRAVSMVGNVYNRSIMEIISQWDPNNVDAQTNTIDRYIESQTSLRVVVALPFVVGHRDDVDSTLWGFQNTRYKNLIEKAEQMLEAKAQAFAASKSAQMLTI